MFSERPSARIAALLMALVLFGAAPARAQVTAARANAFLSSLGINTKIGQNYPWQSYTNAFLYTGIRVARDGGLTCDELHNYTLVGSYPGVKFIYGGAGPGTVVDQTVGLANIGALVGLEGPNEPNNQPFSYNGALGGGGSLPSGLSVNTSTGLLSGTPASGDAGTTYAVALQAANASGARWGVLTLMVNSYAGGPIITNAVMVAASTNSPFSYQIGATNGPTSYDAFYLPPGISVNKATGAITGTPTQAGQYDTALEAINADGTNTAFVAFIVSGDPALPIITSSAVALATTNSAFSYHIKASESPASYGAGASWVPVAQEQRDYYAAIKSNAVLSNYPVFQLTEPGAEVDNVGLQFLTITNPNCLLGNGTVYADFANCHNYVDNGALATNKAWNSADPSLPCPADGIYGEYTGPTWGQHYPGYPTNDTTIPRVTTETSWGTIGSGAITQSQQGKMMMNVYLAEFKRGWSYCCWYEMHDGEGGDTTGEGIYTTNWIAKTAATNMHNLTTILSDTNSSFTPGTLNCSIPSQPATVHDLLLQKADGIFYLVVWDEQVPGANITDSVTVNLGATYSAVSLYDPTVGTNIIQTLTNTNSVPLTLSDHPLILEISNSLAPVTISYNPIGFNGDGVGWTANQNGSFTSAVIVNGLLTLTDGGGDEARSFFFNDPLYIGAFTASFVYQAGLADAADGATFCIQNDPRGPSALGGGGEQLGLGNPSAITPSIELELNLYPGNSQNVGFLVETNGLTAANGANGNYLFPGNVEINSGDPIAITLHYAHRQLLLTFTDLVARTSLATNLDLGDLRQLLGTNAAYVGFTGADGGASSIQTISNFSFLSFPSLSIGANNTNLLLSWPGGTPGYALQQNSDLTTTNWVIVPNQFVLTNGLNQVTTPNNGSNLFYRLILPSPY
jgi:hypothetical protein